MRQRLKDTARRIANLEPGVVILAAPFLLFPSFQPAWTVDALAALLLVWLLRWIGTDRPGARTPLDGSLLLLALMIPISVWASALPELTLPKLTGLILGLAAFRATVNAGRTPRGLAWATALFLLLGLGLTMVGLVSATWAAKWPVLEPVLAGLPRLIQGLPGAETGISPNELGGTVVLFLPIALAACLARGAARRGIVWTVRGAALLSALFFGAVLLLTQSQSAWIGAVVGSGMMVWIRWRRARWPMLGAVVALALGLWYLGPQAVLQAAFQSAKLLGAGPLVSTVSLEGRVELWSRALNAIQDVPFTGCGLGTFRQMVHILYPLFLSPSGADIAHAHNIFLQVAVDLGLPGLIAYLALVGTALWFSWRVARVAGGPYQWLALGLAGSLVAFHVYGLTDTIALGAKPGVAFWMLLGLAAALGNAAQAARQPAVDAAEPSDPEGV